MDKPRTILGELPSFVITIVKKEKIKKFYGSVDCILLVGFGIEFCGQYR